VIHSARPDPRRARGGGARRAALGISLIEALVALAVMAFGLLGVVGMQSTLRFNADVSRQRGEAVRLAQEEIERWRNYSVLRASDAASGQLAFESIVSTGPVTLSLDDANTTFTRTTTVVPEAAGGPLVREVNVLVSWQDRRGAPQEVLLSTQVGYVPPELRALVALRGDRGPLAQPGGRNPLIPRGAVPIEGGRSRFDPPGGAGVGWIFSNDTGLIVAICPPLPATPDLCTATTRQLVAGSFAFARPTLREGSGPPVPVAPAASDAELPLSVLPEDVGIGMQVLRQFPLPVATESCFTSASTDRRRFTYYCAVLADEPSRSWRGVLEPLITVAGTDRKASDVYPNDPTSGPPASSNAAPTDANPANYRVCRYTSTDRNVYTPLPITSASARLSHNTSHPYRYFTADQPYVDRNFLVIQAGYDDEVFGCPTEDPETPIQSNTVHHPRLPPSLRPPS